MWLAAALVLVAACAPRAPVAREADAARAARRWPGTTQADLARGRSLVVARCSGCHRTPRPSSYRPEEWPAQLDEMAPRAHLTLDERVAVERYLITLSERATPGTAR